MIEISWVIFILQLVSSFMMIGIVWLIQAINYPLLKKIPDTIFFKYHEDYLARAQWIIAPLMLIEMVTAGYLLFWPIAQVRYVLYIINFALIFLIWLVTFLIHVPTHRALNRKYSAENIEKLIQWNGLRTVLWTLHGFILTFILY